MPSVGPAAVGGCGSSSAPRPWGRTARPAARTAVSSGWVGLEPVVDVDRLGARQGAHAVDERAARPDQLDGRVERARVAASTRRSTIASARCATGRRPGGAATRGPSRARRPAPGRRLAGRTGAGVPSATSDASVVDPQLRRRSADQAGTRAGRRSSAATTAPRPGQGVALPPGAGAAGRARRSAGLGADLGGHPLRRQVLVVAVARRVDRDGPLVHRLERARPPSDGPRSAVSRSMIQSG